MPTSSLEGGGFNAWPSHTKDFKLVINAFPHYHFIVTDIYFTVTHPFTSINTQVTTVDLTLPKEAIPGTGKCKVSAIGKMVICMNGNV